MRALILAALLFPMVGCTDAGCAKATRYGNKSRVQLWSGGKVAQEWISSGRVNDDDSGSGFYFVDSKTNKMVRVQGDVSVEEIE
jgi:hypothetical protein